MLFTAHLAPLHPDAHTIYEDNRGARRAPLEHSLMDVHAAGRGERERERAGGVGKTKIEVGVSYSFHYCKLNCSFCFIGERVISKQKEMKTILLLYKHCA